jgi:hypothetical protein
MFSKFKWHIILGSVFIALNIYWIFVIIQLWYNYHFSNLEFYFKYPDWVLLVNVILCLAAEIISFKMFRKEIKLLLGVLISSCIWIVCAVINMITVW